MSIESAWNAFTNPHPSVPQSKVIWFKHAVPRWSLTQWMAVLGRLSTRDRLQKWGVIRDAQCVLCQQSTETHGHLFSRCAYSSQLWRSIQSSQNPCCPFDELSQVIGWMVQYGNGDQFSCLVSKISLAALIYHIWGERNRRIFQGYGGQVQQLERSVMTDTRACVSAWRQIKKTTSNLALCSKWTFQARIFGRM